MKKILLIEDNLEVRENTAELLQLANYVVETAENGKIGVDYAKSYKPDLIICDIMMPELDGYGVLYLVSRDPETSSIPFIFLTAKADKSDLRKGMNLGADDYLTKPFEEMELLSAIESRLERSKKYQEDFDSNLAGLGIIFNESKGLEELNKLSEDRRPRKFEKKEHIFYEGDYPNYVYYVQEGKIRTFVMNDMAKELNTGLYKPGDFFGYMSILEGLEHTETAEVLETAEIIKIPREDFLSLLQVNRDVAARFIKLLAQNVKEKEMQLLNLAYESIRKRVAKALIILCNKYNTQEADSFTIQIGRSKLASMVGSSTETVIRTLSEFKDEQLIEMKGSSITIKQQERLDKLKY